MRNAALALWLAAAAHAQLSPSAYRVLGQPDMRSNGLNRPSGIELRTPAGIALQGRRLYVADTLNHRVLGWDDWANFERGAPADVVLGQQGLFQVQPEGIGANGFNSPVAVAVDPATNNLYAADLGHNRVLRFRDPFQNRSRVEPDLAYTGLNQPRALALDAEGNLWVCDTGNNRVVRFPKTALDSQGAAPDVALGQKDLSGVSYGLSATALYGPAGLAFDTNGDLYVSDALNSRVLKFPAPQVTNEAATAVWGQANLTTRVATQAGPSTVGAPAGLAVSGGALFVAAPGDNRVLAFGAAPAATAVIGQRDFTSSAANAGVGPLANGATLSGPADVKADGAGNIFIADTQNNRILRFDQGKYGDAAGVLGQFWPDKNGPNRVKPESINTAFKIAVDYSQAPYMLYVSDAGNHRVLAWKDAVRFRNGAPADLVLGQPDPYTAQPNSETRTGPSRRSLASPRGIAVDQTSGALWVADSGNNRVLRYSRVRDGIVEPDAVLGQADFTSAVSAAITAFSLKEPSGLALGPDGGLFVADSGNRRVLHFPAGAGAGTRADRVLGQPDFTSGAAPGTASAQTLTYPQGLFFDAAASSLFVADTQANRVPGYVISDDMPAAGASASIVIGQPDMQSTAAGWNAAGLNKPSDVARDSQGNLWVSDTGNNRVLMFPPLEKTATAVLGQASVQGTTQNWNSADRLGTPEGLWAPVAVYLDRQDTMYVGDTGNNRILHYVKPAAAVNAGHYQAGMPLSAGTVAALFGTGLARATEVLSSVPLPVSLAAREVAVNESAVAPLYFVSPGQINFQVPAAVPAGANRLSVRVTGTGELVAGGPIAIAAASPALFSMNQQGTGQAAAINYDLFHPTVNSAANPVERGKYVELFGTGLGTVSPAVPDGEAAPVQPLSNTVAKPTSDGTQCLLTQASVCAAIGSTFGDITFSGLAPGMVGVWQLNVRIPEKAVPGSAVPVRVVVNTVPSNIVTIAIK